MLQVVLWCSVGTALLYSAPTANAQKAAVRSATTTRSTSAGRIAPRGLPTATASKLRLLLANPALRDARIGLCIVALGKAKSAQDFAVHPYAGGTQPTLWAKDAETVSCPLPI
jgi:hypothetical protein